MITSPYRLAAGIVITSPYRLAAGIAITSPYRLAAGIVITSPYRLAAGIVITSPYRLAASSFELLVSPITAKRKCVFHIESTVLLPVTSQGVIVPWGAS